MTTELQNKVWSILPKEFKEEVKKSYRYYSRMAKDQYDCGIVDCIETIFGKHNLTSDAEGEELLTVKAKTVREMYAANERLKASFPGTIAEADADKINHILRHLFGSKCLPDELNEYNFATKEPKPAEPTCTRTCTDNCPSQPVNLFQETANCDKCNGLRLHIAAMAMQGILGNADRMKSYEQIAMSEPYEDLPAVVARKAVRYANALIAESEKGGRNEKV